MTNLKPTSIWIIAALFSFTTQAQSDTINQRTNQGKQDGYWIVYGKDQPHKNYPPDGKIMEGKYIDGRKHGKWIMYHSDGETPRSIGQFNMGQPKGPYTKYHPNGKPKQIGTFKNGKQIGEFKIISETGVVLQEKTFDENGKEDGKIVFRFPDGTIELEAERKGGEPVGVEKRFYANGNLKSKTTYGNGEPKKETFERTDPEKKIIKIDSGKKPPNGRDGSVNNGDFKSTGYNKVYNDNRELWMDGIFRNNLLWDGKVYIYDNEGILLKIEIWKEGRYHSDGQLGGT